MKINKRKQYGVTLISWLIIASIGIVIGSAAIKVVPYYIEFHNVKGVMKNIASTKGIKNANIDEINKKIEKHLAVNNLYALEDAYYASRASVPGKSKAKKPFTIKKQRKSKRRILTVAYDVPQSWIGNLFFLIKFKHAVVLGEPDVVIKTTIDKSEGQRKRKRLNLN